MADPERAEPLKTVASFLIDFELAELTFLEIVTGGFTVLPFDPAVEADEADVQELFEMYDEMVAQEDAVWAALSQIEGRAEVSLGVLYVRSPWAPVPGWTDLLKKKLEDWLSKDDFFGAMNKITGKDQRDRIARIAGRMKEGLSEDELAQAFNRLEHKWMGSEETGEWANDFDSWVDLVRCGVVPREHLGGITGMLEVEYRQFCRGDRSVDAAKRAGRVLVEKGAKKYVEVLGDVPVVGKMVDVTKKALEWEEYAKKLAKDLGGTLEESARGRVQKALEDKVKSNLKERFPKLSDKAIDGLAQYFAKKAVAVLPKLPSPLTPTVAAKPTATQAAPAPSASPSPSPSPAPSPSASPSPTAEVTPDTGWIEGYVQGIANGWLDKGYEGIDVAVAADDLRQCLTDRVVNLRLSQNEAIGECPAWLFEPVLTPEPTETPQPQETPTSEPSETPTPEARQVTASGQYVENIGSYDPASTPGAVVLRNTMTLTFNTAGGPVSGEGYTEVKAPAVDEECKGKTNIQSLAASYEGAYDPDLKQFGGVRHYDLEHLLHVSVFDEAAGVMVCEIHDLSGSFSTAWIAWLEDGVVTGWDESGWTFELTVQG